MELNNDQLNQLVEKMKSELLPEILAAGDTAISSYELGRDEDGIQNYTNYTLGCSFWDNSFNRLKRLCSSKNTFFQHKEYNNILEINADIQGKMIAFFIARVNEVNRIPRSAKSIKNILQSQILQNQKFLSEEIKEIISHRGIYTIGVDLDTENGIGKVTFDLLLPVAPKGCQAVTKAILYDSNIHEIEQAVPETITRPSVHLDSPRHLAKAQQHDRESSPEQNERSLPTRKRQEQQIAKKANG